MSRGVIQSRRVSERRDMVVIVAREILTREEQGIYLHDSKVRHRCQAGSRAVDWLEDNVAEELGGWSMAVLGWGRESK